MPNIPVILLLVGLVGLLLAPIFSLQGAIPLIPLAFAAMLLGAIGLPANYIYQKVKQHRPG